MNRVGLEVFLGLDVLVHEVLTGENQQPKPDLLPNHFSVVERVEAGVCGPHGELAPVRRAAD